MTMPGTLPEALGLIAELQTQVEHSRQQRLDREREIGRLQVRISRLSAELIMGEGSTDQAQHTGAGAPRVATTEEAMNNRLQELSDEVATLRQELHGLPLAYDRLNAMEQVDRRRRDALGMALQLVGDDVGVISTESAAELVQAAAVFEAYMERGIGPREAAPASPSYDASYDAGAGVASRPLGG